MHKNKNFVFNNEIEAFNCAEGINRKILAYCDKLMCVENRFEEGAIGVLHSHPHTQITYVAEGEFEFTIGDETKLVKKGDTLLKEDNIIHGAVCKKKGILIDIFTPFREDFL